MKRRNKIIAAVISGIALLGGLVGCSHHRSPEERAEHMVEKVASKLELAPHQVELLETVKNELLQVRQSMKQERDQVHDEVKQLLSQPTLDQERAVKLVRDRTDAVNQKAPQIISAFANFYDSLTPEQQAKLREKLVELESHRHHWHH